MNEKLMEILQFEKLPLPEEEEDPKCSEDTSSSSDSDEEIEEGASQITTTEEREKSDKIRGETIDMILDCVVPPKRIEKSGKEYLLRLSRALPNRNEVAQLSRKFEDYLRDYQVRMQGYCPIRRDVYDLLFDELIRQSTLFCPERGALLLRVRDEFLMTHAAYQKLFENGVQYGARKALEAEVETQSLKLQHGQLEAELARAEKRIRDLQAEVYAEESLSQQRIDVKQLKHEEKMEFLRKANKQLKEQLSMIT